MTQQRRDIIGGGIGVRYDTAWCDQYVQYGWVIHDQRRDSVKVLDGTFPVPYQSGKNFGFEK
jgi:hypothetical protein